MLGALRCCWPTWPTSKPTTHGQERRAACSWSSAAARSVLQLRGARGWARRSGVLMIAGGVVLLLCAVAVLSAAVVAAVVNVEVGPHRSARPRSPGPGLNFSLC